MKSVRAIMRRLPCLKLPASDSPSVAPNWSSVNLLVFATVSPSVPTTAGANRSTSSTAWCCQARRRPSDPILRKIWGRAPALSIISLRSGPSRPAAVTWSVCSGCSHHRLAVTSRAFSRVAYKCSEHVSIIAAALCKAQLALGGLSLTGKGQKAERACRNSGFPRSVTTAASHAHTTTRPTQNSCGMPACSDEALMRRERRGGAF